MPRYPARLHVLLARNAPVGVVIRRGPSKEVATLSWDRRKDMFGVGQWLNGRIYPRRSDLSPDGKYLIYFAMNGQWESESRGSWTAISRAPYLKAISFFPKGDGWHGGGLWTADNTYWLNDGYGHTISREATCVRRDHSYDPSPNYGGECLGVYYHRLLRDGWSFVSRQNVSKFKDMDIFEKRVGHGWTLRKMAHAEIGAPMGKGCYWDEHELFNHDGSQTIQGPTWEWAELDGKRLVWAEEGRLFSANIRSDGLADRTLLQDFNDMHFSRVKAPY